MKNIEVLASINGVNLCKDNDFYFIKRNDGFMWDMAGSKEEVKEELKRWLIEVDQDNNYMNEIETHFIRVLDNLN